MVSWHIGVIGIDDAGLLLRVLPAYDAIISTKLISKGPQWVATPISIQFIEAHTQPDLC